MGRRMGRGADARDHGPDVTVEDRTGIGLLGAPGLMAGVIASESLE
ncbi:MAG: hypothetical protein IIC49_02460 [Planctomycetes bacterium]|nr:hypothetical protein [Planctomycetota bacterium]